MIELDLHQVFLERIHDSVVRHAIPPDCTSDHIAIDLRGDPSGNGRLTHTAVKELVDFQSKIVHQITSVPSRIRSPTTFLSGSSAVSAAGAGITVIGVTFFALRTRSSSSAMSCETARHFW